MAFVVWQHRPFPEPRQPYLVESYREGGRVRRRYLLNMHGYAGVGEIFQELERRRRSIRRWDRDTLRYREGRRLRRFASEATPAELAEATKRAGRARTEQQVRDLIAHADYLDGPLDDHERMKPVLKLLDDLAEILVARPRSRRRLWPDADEWLRRR